MCCEVICSLWRSARACCMCIRIRKGVHLISVIDIFEVVLNATLIYFWASIKESVTLVPFALILLGNLLPCTIRIVGLCIRLCGALRLWTRGAMFCSRLCSMIFMVILLFFQMMITYFVLHDQVEDVSRIPLIGPFLETESTEKMEAGENYDKLGYGFCTYCDPTGDCQSEFEAYRETGVNGSSFKFMSKLFNAD